MTNTDTADIEGTIAQVAALSRAGSEMVRITVDREEAAAAVPHIRDGLRKRGIDVPGRVAVTGFDDIPLARHLRTSLTTVRQPIKQLGTTAFDVLYSMLNREYLAARDIVLPTELIRRESCGCPAPPERADIGWYREI